MNIFRISANQDFLDELINGIENRIDKTLLSKTLILLPSLMSCRALEHKFTERSSNLILPRIVPMGAIEDALSFEVIESLNTIPKSITYTEAKFLLANLIRAEAKEPTVYSEALNIASELLKLISKFDKEDISLSQISKIFIGDTSIHIERIFNYLKLISKAWPKLLTKHNSITPIARRNIFIKTLIKKWSTLPPSYPIIAAGSTGTFHSTQILLDTISSLPNGFVIMQGIENLDILDHTNIDEKHPCFQLHSLIKTLKVTTKEIQPWHLSSEITALKQSLIKTLFETTPTFSSNPITLSNKETLEYLECTSTQEEATIIAIKIRELLSQGLTNIGVVTNEKNLRTRVATLLKLWNIKAESSDGIALKFTPQYSFLTAIFTAAYEEFSSISLLKLLQHEFFTLAHDVKEITSRLERKYFRGIRKYQNITELISTTLHGGDKDISILLGKILTLYKPLLSLLGTRCNTRSILRSLIDLSEKLSTQESSETSIMWQGEFGAKLRDIIYSILLFITKDNISPTEFETIFYETISEQTLPAYSSCEAQVYILTPIESRLLKFDYLILSGLNEKTWPEPPEIDPWLSTTLYSSIGLSNHNASIGQSAGDFLLLMQHNQILLTRSSNTANSPQVASRWMSKMEVWAHRMGIFDQIKPTTHYLKTWAKKLNEPQIFTKYIAPTPRPPIALRPTKLSVTQIEKLMRDPYSIYASKILKLKPLEPLDKKPNQLEFGNFIHQVLDQFNKQSDSLDPEKYLEALTEIGDGALNSMITNPIIQKIWRPRFYKIASWFAEYEKNIRQTNAIATEENFSITLNDSFSLVAKVDRIETNLKDNTIRILDFKTGGIPTQEDIRTGFSPQLPLEAFIISETDKLGQVSELIYIQLATGKKIGHITEIKCDTSIIEAAKKGTTMLIEKYSDINTPYLICPYLSKAPIYNEFKHLERVDEL